MEEMCRLAPVSRAMVCQATYHLVQICQQPRKGVDSARTEGDMHTKWNAAIVVWIVKIFIDILNETGVSRKDNWYARYLLSSELVNLIFECISLISGRKQLSFVRLLSALIRLDVEFDPQTSATLKGLMNRTFTVQQPKKKFTTFMQALIELMLSVEQIEMQRGRLVATNQSSAKVAETKAKEGADEKVDSVVVEGKDGGGTKAGTSSSSASSGAAVMRRTQFFEHQYDFDTNGILYYLGLEGSSSDWSNPALCQTRPVHVSSSPMLKTSQANTAIVGRSAVRCMTKPVVKPYFTLDFHGLLIVPTCYTVRHAAPRDSEVMRSWVFEGSLNGESWVVLDRRENCQDLQKAGDSHTWKVDSTQALISQISADEEKRKKGEKVQVRYNEAGEAVVPGYTMFRVRMTDKNSSRSWHLACSGFEIYGYVTFPELSDKLTWEEEEIGRSKGMELIRFSKVMARHIARDGVWEVVRASQSLASGRHYFEVEFIERDLDMQGVYERYKGDDIIQVGVVDAKFSMQHKNLRIGKPQKGWAYSSRGCTDLNDNYGEAYGPGDCVGVEIDMDVGTIEFWKNGKSQGLAYVDVTGPVYPAVGLYLQSPQVKLVTKSVEKLKKSRNQKWFDDILLLHDTLEILNHGVREVGDSVGDKKIITAGKGKGRPALPARMVMRVAEQCFQLGMNERKESDDANQGDLDQGEDDEDTDLSSERKAARLLQGQSGKAKAELFKDLIEEINTVHQIFTPGRDKSLVDLVDQRICERRSTEQRTVQGTNLTLTEFDPTERDLEYYRLSQLPRRALLVRLVTLQVLNRQLRTTLPLIDFSVRGDVSRLAGLVRGVRKLIFWGTKEGMWKEALAASRGPGADKQPDQVKNALTVPLDRFKAMRFKEKLKSDSRARKSIFGQMFCKLYSQTPAFYRLDQGVRAFLVEFRGEGGEDVGGLYREAFHLICKELQHDEFRLLPLFVPCPNKKADAGENRDKWVPNSESTEPLHISLFELLGKLMGLALRTKNSLNLDLPPIVWKLIIRDKVTDADVESIDVTAFNSALDLAGVASAIRADASVPKDKRALEFENRVGKQFFETRNVVGRKVLLAAGDGTNAVPGGGGDDSEVKKTRVSWDNWREYRGAVSRFKRTEFDVQIDSMRRGMACVVPFALLGMFTWEEIEREVCGERKMNIDLLKKMTKYENCFASDQHIKIFWEMLEDRFNEAERALWLKFVWGRSRLPVRAADFDMKFCIQTLRSAEESPNPDAFLPIAHTCFFSLQLPRYSSLDVMHKRVLWAITNCESIDADFAAGEIQGPSTAGDSDDEH